jgi:hypothetical protein
LGPANVLQCFFAQNIGIAFTGFDKRDELCLFDVTVAVSSPQSLIWAGLDSSFPELDEVAARAYSDSILA